MGGVDRGDQLRGYYSCCTKSRKFYKYNIFYFLLDVAITNAFVPYKHYAACSKFKNMRDFRVQLTKELIGDYCSRWRVGRQGSSLKNLPLRHFPVKLEPADATHHNQHRCTRCLDKSYRHPVVLPGVCCASLPYRQTIDRLFPSLAQEHGPRSIILYSTMLNGKRWTLHGCHCAWQPTYLTDKMDGFFISNLHNHPKAILVVSSYLFFLLS